MTLIQKECIFEKKIFLAQMFLQLALLPALGHKEKEAIGTFKTGGIDSICT